MLSKYALHPDFADVKDSNRYDPPNGPLEQMRTVNELLREQSKNVKADGVHVQEETRTIIGYEGAQIRVRIFRPVGAKGPLPCGVYFHGGAWLCDVVPFHLNLAMMLAEKVPCVVVMVEYRLALDYPFPYGLEDCYAGLQWVFAHAAEIGVDQKRIAVFGESSGGNFAAAACLMARDRGANLPCYQMLIYPVTDSSMTSESMNKYVDTPEVNCYSMRAAWKFYLANGDCGMPQYAAPLLAEDLSGLPPAYVESAEFDPLHDEVLAYAKKLQAAGVPVELNETLGTFHAFDMHMECPYSVAVLEHRVEVLRRVLGE